MLDAEHIRACCAATTAVATPSPELLSAEEHQALFDRIITHDEVDSTNVRVKEDMKARGGSCVHTALVQTSGYGRQGRSWTSPKGGLYASLGIDLAQFLPTPLREDISTLSLVVGLSVKAALGVVSAASGIESSFIQIKWPNDVLVDDAKICGISLELFNSTMLCIGVGINVVRTGDASNGTEADAKYRFAYASDEVLGSGDDLSVEQLAFMEELLGRFLAEFEKRFTLWVEQGFVPFVDEFNDCLAWKGKQVQIEYVDGRPLDSGVVSAVTERGTLLLEQPHRHHNHDANDERSVFVEVASGEVHFLPLETSAR